MGKRRKSNTKKKIGAKILTGFIVLLVLVAVIGASGIIAIRTLSALSDELYRQQSLGHSISSVLNAHFTWRQNLTVAVFTGSKFSGSLDPETCVLGQWLETDEAKNISDPVILNYLAQIKVPHENIHNDAKIVIDYLEAGNRKDAEAYFIGYILPQTQIVINNLTEMERQFDVTVIDITYNIRDTQSLSIIIIIVLVCAAVAAGIVLAWQIPRSIVQPLGFLTNFMQRATATGDITISPEDAGSIQKFSSTKDEIAECINSCVVFYNHVSDIAQTLEVISNKNLAVEIPLLSDKDIMSLSVNRMIDILNVMFGEISMSAGQVASGSKQISASAQALAQSASEQASTVDNLSVSVSDILEKTKENTALAERAAKLADTIKDNAEHGSHHMDELIEAVRDINEANRNVIKVIKVIDDIAFQTNILALNAAVEAARAGAAGKGFAVVADEVRNLAAKSADAAKSTESLIKDSIEKAEMGSRIADETEASLEEIVSGINESSQIFTSIAKSSEEQLSGIEQITSGIEQVSHVVQQNSATAEESAAASDEMSGQSSMLEELIGQFKLKE